MIKTVNLFRMLDALIIMIFTLNICSLRITNNVDVTPIMSFHQCGGSVGYDYDSYLPS